jgi:type II secretory pathway component PulM
MQLPYSQPTTAAAAADTTHQTSVQKVVSNSIQAQDVEDEAAQVCSTCLVAIKLKP